MTEIENDQRWREYEKMNRKAMDKRERYTLANTVENISWRRGDSYVSIEFADYGSGRIYFHQLQEIGIDTDFNAGFARIENMIPCGVTVIFGDREVSGEQLRTMMEANVKPMGVLQYPAN